MYSLITSNNKWAVAWEKRKKSDPVLWQKPLYQKKYEQGEVTTKTTQQKSSITQRLRTDLGRSVGVPRATQLQIDNLD